MPKLVMLLVKASKLKLYLPQAVKDTEGSAKFDALTKTLTLTLPILKEFY